MGNEACAGVIRLAGGAAVENAKALAYRLYSIAERKGWAAEAGHYNNLIISWQEIQAAVLGLERETRRELQETLL